MDQHFDVVILGAGLAGITLARHILLHSQKNVLLLDKREQIPPQKQKVGESTVQLAGFYFSKTLDLEEYLHTRHFVKYNLRFYWRPEGSTGDDFDQFGQSYLREMSNILSFQLNRNHFERDVLEMNKDFSNFSFMGGISDLDLQIKTKSSSGKNHFISFQHEGKSRKVSTEWLVDCSGRNRSTSGKTGNSKEKSFEHSSVFFWVDGLVNIEKLTGRSHREIHNNKDKRALGHTPYWLATNHFMGEGSWFWVIPIRDKTSFGLVFDNRKVDLKKVATKEGFLGWLGENFPLFLTAINGENVQDFTVLKNLSHQCPTAISAEKWAVVGDAGRFLDPLYSPGSDFISLHNTLLGDLMINPSEGDLMEERTDLYDRLLKALFESVVPSYQTSYDTLGDQVAFSLKYTWDLAIYYSFFVFPFINNMFTRPEFIRGYLKEMQTMGTINQNMQKYFSDFFQWKKGLGLLVREKVLYDFSQVTFLKTAQQSFYQTGLTVQESLAALRELKSNANQMAKFLIALTDSFVAGDNFGPPPGDSMERINIFQTQFDPALIFQRHSKAPKGHEGKLSHDLSP